MWNTLTQYWMNQWIKRCRTTGPTVLENGIFYMKLEPACMRPSDKSNNNLSVLVNRAILASNSRDVIELTLLTGSSITRLVFEELFTGCFAEHERLQFSRRSSASTRLSLCDWLGSQHNNRVCRRGSFRDSSEKCVVTCSKWIKWLYKKKKKCVWGTCPLRAQRRRTGQHPNRKLNLGAAINTRVDGKHMHVFATTYIQHRTTPSHMAAWLAIVWFQLLLTY